MLCRCGCGGYRDRRAFARRNRRRLDELIATWRALDKPFAKGMEWRDPRVHQRADEPTKEFVKYIKAQPLLKAVLCGHNHRYWQGRFSPYAMQYVCSATYMGQCYAIDFV